MNRIFSLTQKRVIKDETVHPAVIEAEDGITLFDCGDPELFGTLEAAMAEKGLDPKRLRRVIITHHDLDHMGGLSQLIDRHPEVEVIATAVEAEYICGRSRWLRLQDEDSRYLALPAEQRVPSSRVRAAQYMYFLPGRVDRIVSDADVLDICGGCCIISTPWHTPGHISVYIPAEKAFITGDALNTFDSRIGLNSRVDLCPQHTKAGLMRLAELDVETVYGYHGGELRLSPGQFREQLLALCGEL